MFFISGLGIASYYLNSPILLYICGTIIIIDNLIHYIKALLHHRIYITTRPIFYSVLGILIYNDILQGILIGFCIKEFVDNIVLYFIKFMKLFQK